MPGRPDGTASFPGIFGLTVLVNNHEQSTGDAFPAVAGANLTYDPGAGGGTTTILVDNRNQPLLEYVSLAGTFSNCAGGATPWGTWLTCEETEQRAGGAVHQGPRLRVRGVAVRAVREPRPHAAHRARPLRTRGRRRRSPTAATST